MSVAPLSHYMDNPTTNLPQNHPSLLKKGEEKEKEEDEEDEKHHIAAFKQRVNDCVPRTYSKYFIMGEERTAPPFAANHVVRGTIATGRADPDGKPTWWRAKETNSGLKWEPQPKFEEDKHDYMATQTVSDITGRTIEVRVALPPE